MYSYYYIISLYERVYWFLVGKVYSNFVILFFYDSFMKYLSFLLLACFLVLSGCMHSAPVTNVDADVDVSDTDTSVKDEIRERNLPEDAVVDDEDVVVVDDDGDAAENDEDTAENDEDTDEEDLDEDDGEETWDDVVADTDEEADEDTGEDEAMNVVFDVDGFNFWFSLSTIEVNAGDTVTINLKSTGWFHDWVIDEFNAATAQVSDSDGVTSVTFVADTAGTYEYYCSVGQHRANGMVGTLIVK